MNDHFQYLEFQRSDRVIRCGFSALQGIFPDLSSTQLPEISTEEWQRAHGYRHGRAKNLFILGRSAAKKALKGLNPEVNLVNVHMGSGFAGNPILEGVSNAYEVSISHSDDFAVSVVAPAIHPVTLDWEWIRPARAEAISRMLTSAELNFVDSPEKPESTLTLLWTAKEALSKWLRSGMSIHFKTLEIRSMKRDGDQVRGEFANVFHLRFESWKIANGWLTFVFPNKSRLLSWNYKNLESFVNQDRNHS